MQPGNKMTLNMLASSLNTDGLTDFKALETKLKDDRFIQHLLERKNSIHFGIFSSEPLSVCFVLVQVFIHSQNTALQFILCLE